MSREARNNTNNVVDLQDYVGLRRIAGALEALKIYLRFLDEGRNVADIREHVIGILSPFYEQEEIAQRAMGLTSEQIADIEAGGEIPRRAVEKFVARLEYINAHPSEYTRT
ncbi:hypothetical protein KJ657_00025 [Patescibacteria group bacterium]|nr:hypothetical protein [Nanoarchaeota archaeon]MBU1015464.1 hypothetical protein [Patescibacteria group bacterium]MBU1938299.1 hypothetical protein [Patescibacteria group bacterium]